ncbi:hypothetical protein [uncultured Albimonas sp.]|uniref:hypothetical protein n=1 Tax=uncultured Albimonas sp. TaxID=1331701 RepID=UPI0030ED4D90|tara:strand:- start:1622 stop:2074 length:453 start_codon:yes stop_codon:yes gene_type:complete
MTPHPTLARLACATALLAAPLAVLASGGAAADAAIVERLGLTEARFEEDRRNPDLHGTLPGGVRVEIEFHRDGSLDEIEATGQQPFPAAAIAPALPAAVRSAPDWPADARLWSVEFDADGVEIEGIDAAGRSFEAEFAPDGRLIDMDVDD